MKTKNFIPTVLALIIRVMVTGQTQEIQSQYQVLSMLGGKANSSSCTAGIQKHAAKDKDNVDSKNESLSPSSARKIYPTLISEETRTPGIDNNTFNYYNNPACYASRVYANELLKQADELLAIAETLRKQTNEKGDSESAAIVNPISSLQKQAELKQIQASEISGKLSVELFNQNELAFKKLLEKVKREVVCEMAADLNNQAVYFIKSAKNMREEAYAAASATAKLGMMGNAEEKEGQALAKQEEALTMLKNAIVAVTYFESHDLATR